MNTREKILLYAGSATIVLIALARILHYLEAKEMGSMMVLGWVLILNAYRNYAKRLQRRNAELELLVTPPSAPAA
ncbi:hypothetical protein [Hymenobacter sublimis]|uniref:Uncharacterized protein n=1 Tax=Hymenobacter sublimis TaxID=2933777 RepID=A0ABY4J6M9_9BACT|nr:hypothetical protein [Hymenobacter sublimis]UPL47628.1 hypothetical protein MWH26_10505 [Hymenobacter sublimis]